MKRPENEHKSEAEQILESNDLTIVAVVRGIDTIDRVEKFVAYENQHKKRTWVFERLEERAKEIRNES